MKLVEITDEIVRLTFDTQYEQAISMFRIQEFYETKFKDLRDSITNFEKVMDIQAREDGGFTYTADIVGHNIPGYQVKKFFNLFNDSEHHLLEKERAIKDAVAPWLKKRSEWYLIAAFGEGNSYAHELAHALFYLNTDYKKQALKLQKRLPIKYFNSVKKILIDDYDYSIPVIPDEVNAYLATSTMHQIVDFFGASNVPWRRIQDIQMLFLETVTDLEIEV